MTKGMWRNSVCSVLSQSLLHFYLLVSAWNLCSHVPPLVWHLIHFYTELWNSLKMFSSLFYTVWFLLYPLFREFLLWILVSLLISLSFQCCLCISVLIYFFFRYIFWFLNFWKYFSATAFLKLIFLKIYLF